LVGIAVKLFVEFFKDAIKPVISVGFSISEGAILSKFEAGEVGARKRSILTDVSLA